jgi:hypothetical protein
MKVFIIDSSYPRDFYKDRLDGFVARNLLNTMDVQNKLRMVIDLDHFKEAIRDAAAHEFDVLHLSCHGDDSGIALCDNSQPSWKEFAKIFDDKRYSPSALIMSACCGASGGIGEAFRNVKHRPMIIFGSITPLSYGEYCAAWAILYHRLTVDGVNRPAARTAMEHINAVVTHQFVYRRWNDENGGYAYVPGKHVTYSVEETKVQRD